MSFEGRLNLQGSRATFIERVETETRSEGFRNLGVVELQTKLDMLEFYWAKFEEQHEKLVAGKDPAILSHGYVTGRIFDLCLERYTRARVALMALIKQKDDTVDVFSRSFHVPHANAAAPAQRTAARLPKIDIKKFDGDYKKWSEWKDYFENAVIKADISLVEKMIYLKSTLEKEAAQLISNVSSDAQSFAAAWDLLTSRYDNPRLLVTAQLEALLGTKQVVDRSAKALNGLIASVTQALDALKMLQCPTEHWGAIVVFSVAQRLDDKTREAWEIKIGSTKEYPTWEQLKEFLTGRARARECIEMNAARSSAAAGRAPPAGQGSGSAPKGQQQKGAKALAVTSQKAAQPPKPAEEPSSWADMVAEACSCCEEAHFMVFCPKFRQLTPEKRMALVKEKYLCFNCLGKHGIKDCRSQKVCSMCKKRHHTMLHLPRDQPRAGGSGAAQGGAGKSARPAQPASPPAPVAQPAASDQSGSSSPASE